MAGLSNTTRFALGAATVMLGTPSALWDLLPAANSIGLVKNFSISTEPTFTDLTQGPKNTTVYSMLTKNDVKAQMEVYEYTAQNLTYGLSLDGTSVAAQTVKTTTTAAVLGFTTAPTLIIPATSVTGLNSGDVIMLVAPGSDDVVLVRKIVSITSLNITVDVTIKADFASGSTILKVNSVDVGSQVTPPFFAAKVVGSLADGTIATILLPKVRITKGFTVAFNSEQYGNMPFEFEMIDLVPSDSFYSTFSSAKSRLYIQ